MTLINSSSKIVSFFDKLKFNKLNFNFNVNNLTKGTFICYRIFKYDPSIDIKPWLQVYFFGAHEHAPMLLDTLFFIKNKKDSTLSFRRSCREGICGSCAMNINGRNSLACIYKIDEHVSEDKPYINVFPLPHMPVIKDLIIDMKHFYNQYKSINPFLIQPYLRAWVRHYLYLKQYYGDLRCAYYPFPVSYLKLSVFVSRPTIENHQTKKDRKLLDGLYECILCACCTTSCPSYWWNSDKYLGPAVSLQAYRWVIDSRDNFFYNRLDYLDDIYKLNRCHTILNCIRCCPKKLSPATAIANIKQIISYCE